MAIILKFILKWFYKMKVPPAGLPFLIFTGFVVYFSLLRPRKGGVTGSRLPLKLDPFLPAP